MASRKPHSSSSMIDLRRMGGGSSVVVENQDFDDDLELFASFIETTEGLFE